jgi:hypothetical protein
MKRPAGEIAFAANHSFSASLRFPVIDVAQSLFTLLEREGMEAGRHGIESKRRCDPSDGLCPRLEDTRGVAPRLGFRQRFECIVQAAFRFAQRRIGKPSEGRVVLAARPHADPGAAGRASPDRAVVVAIGIVRVAEPRQQCARAAVVAERLGESLDGAADSHGDGFP